MFILKSEFVFCLARKIRGFLLVINSKLGFQYERLVTYKFDTPQETPLHVPAY
jgi:hypothetical protein